MNALPLLLAPLLVSAPQETAADDRVRVAVAHDVSLSVRDTGEGPAVLLLTGGPGFAGTYFEPLAAELSTDFRVVLPDQRGSGRSKVDSYEQGFDFATFVADLEAVRVALDLERWSLVGHSWGGLLSMAYAAEHPDRVVSLGLVGSAGIDASFWATYQGNLMKRLDADSMTELGSLRPTGQTLDDMAEYSRAANRIMAAAMVADASLVERLRADFTPDNFNPRVALSMREMQSYDLRPKLAGWKRPTLLLQGDQDPIGMDTAERTAEVLGGTIHVFEGVGHMSYLECPDELSATLRAFLKAEAGAEKGQ